MALAGKKIAVWFKGRQIVQHAFVDRCDPTLPSAVPGTYLLVVEYDDLGNITETQVHMDGVTLILNDAGGLAHGTSLPSIVDLTV